MTEVFDDDLVKARGERERDVRLHRADELPVVDDEFVVYVDAVACAFTGALQRDDVVPCLHSVVVAGPAAGDLVLDAGFEERGSSGRVVHEALPVDACVVDVWGNGSDWEYRRARCSGRFPSLRPGLPFCCSVTKSVVRAASEMVGTPRS